MQLLDPRSIIIVASLTYGLMAVVLYLMRRNYPRNIRGLGHWAGAAALWFCSAMLLSGRNLGLPDFVVVLLPNIMLVGGTLLYYMGCRLFFEQPARWWPWLVLFVVFALGFAGWVYIHNSYVNRLILFTATVLAIYMANLGVLLQHGGKRLSVRVVELFLAFQIVIVLSRMVTSPADMTADRLYEQSLVQVIYLSSFAIAHFFFTVSAVLMATDRLVAALENLAHNDALTHLPNRRALFERMENEIARVKRNSGRCGPTLLMFDLDHFKAVNDTLGHQHGDKVLVHFAQTLREQLRKTDYVGRYGGEEFMAMLPETDQAGALQITQRIHDATHNGHTLANPVSIGLATWGGADDTLEALISRADSAVYAAKAKGRNCTCVA
ncbi:MAG: GGDEF domain-containing protein [Comamonas sp.]|nr:GGDEF domain-containing protein [Comamonas sp.]